MKQFLIAILILFSVSAFGQGSAGNNERLREIEIEIKQAVDAGNFDKASELKKEKDIRLQIQKAVSDGNFEEAGRLQNQLANTQKGSNNNQGSGTGAPVQNRTNEVYVDQSRGAGSFSDDSEAYTKLLKNGIYLDLGVGMNSQSSNIAESLDRTRLALKAGFGMRIFFGRNGERSRFGVDMNFVSVMPQFGNFSEPSVELQVVRPGVVYSMALSEKMALDASANLGLSLAFGGSQTNSYSDVEYDYALLGIAFTQSTRLRMNKWSFVGVDIGYATHSGDMDRYQYNISGGGGYRTVNGSLNTFMLMLASGFKF